jgi:hypothetical protein
VGRALRKWLPAKIGGDPRLAQGIFLCFDHGAGYYACTFDSTRDGSVNVTLTNKRAALHTPRADDLKPGDPEAHRVDVSSEPCDDSPSQWARANVPSEGCEPIDTRLLSVT